MPPVSTGYGPVTGVMGGSADRSLPELLGTRSSQSVPSFPLNDYRRSTLGTGYNITSSGVETNTSLNGIAGSSNSTTYGYLTESMTARSTTLTPVPDFDRRDVYKGYRTNQPSQERQEYIPTSTYDSTRMSSMGLSVSSSLALGPNGSTTRLSDTIVITNVNTKVFVNENPY